MTFCRSIYVKKVMKLCAFIFLNSPGMIQSLSAVATCVLHLLLCSKSCCNYVLIKIVLINFNIGIKFLRYLVVESFRNLCHIFILNPNLP